MKNLKQKYALSDEGARSMIIASVANIFYNLVLFSPVVLLYFLIKDILGDSLEDKATFYLTGICIWVLLLIVTAMIQYNTCFFSTYKESGVRRITLAEKLRKLPLSFFAQKDSADLTSTLMDDAASIEQASSHFIPQLIGSIISTCILAVCLFFVNWKMALAAVCDCGIVKKSSVQTRQEKEHCRHRNDRTNPRMFGVGEGFATKQCAGKLFSECQGENPRS